mmetsp:Transcript_28842/g.52977  ORF Transcript_28842/g.52977 Transcript_28842/m.52977 type:complete len:216 (+) Transcript_28842:731-1378(+)
MIRESAEALFSHGVPDPDCVVLGSTGEVKGRVAAMGRLPGEGGDPGPVATAATEILPGFWIPQPDHAVHVAGGHVLGVGRPGHGQDPVAVSSALGLGTLGPHIPEAKGCVPAATGQTAAVGTKGDGQNGLTVSLHRGRAARNGANTEGGAGLKNHFQSAFGRKTFLANEVTNFTHQLLVANEEGEGRLLVLVILIIFIIIATFALLSTISLDQFI